MKWYLKAILFIGGTPFGNLLQAQEFSLHGFVQVNYSLRVAETDGLRTLLGSPPPDYLLGDERVRRGYMGG